MKITDYLRYRLFLALSGNKLPVDSASATKMQMYYMLNTNIENLKNLSNIHQDIQNEMIKRSPDNIKYISNPSEKTQLEVMSKSPDYYQKISNPCEMAQIELIEKDPLSIALIDKPSEKVQLFALSKNPTSICYIKNPTEKVQLYAVNKKPETLKLIDKPSSKVVEFAITKDDKIFSYLKNPTEREQLIAIRKNANNIADIENPSSKVQLYTLMKDPNLITSIERPDLDAQIYAINHKIAITQIKNPADKVVLMAANEVLGRQAFNTNKILDKETKENLIHIIKYPNLADLDGRVEKINQQIKGNPVIQNDVSDEKNIIGKIDYYAPNGDIAETLEFTDKDKYLKAIKDELYSNPKGFKENTIVDDEQLKNDIKNVYADAYGIDDDTAHKNIKSEIKGNKYELLEDDTKEFEGKKLYRIKACKDFGDVKAGDKGGYVETEYNLTQNGNSWIYDNSIVKDQAIVSDDATIKGNSIVKEQARVVHKATVQDKSIVKGESLIKNNATVTNAKIFDKAILENNANIHDDFIVGNTRVSDANFVNKKEMYGNERQQLEIIDSDNAVIHENGKTWNANDVMTGIKGHGVNPDDISKAQLNKLAVGQKVQLPGAKGNTQFSLLKKAGGYGLQTFSIAKQINSALEQSM